MDSNNCKDNTESKKSKSKKSSGEKVSSSSKTFAKFLKMPLKSSREAIYKLTHPQIDVESTCESDGLAPVKFKELEITPPEEELKKASKEDLKQPFKRIEPRLAEHSKEAEDVVDLRELEITAVGLRPKPKRATSVRIRTARATPESSLKTKPQSEKAKPKAVRKPNGKKPSPVTVTKRKSPVQKPSPVTETERKATAQMIKPRAVSAPLVPETAWDCADLEDDNPSTKAFYESLQKCAEPRLAWMERTLKKGLSYQLRKFRANRRYKAPDATTLASDANPHKDRYIDIRCLDATRVVLRDSPSDYINANYIVSLTGRKFICTQAPLEKTKEDFWKMIVQERCRTIVMLCSDQDECKDKYTCYYPSCVGEKMVVGKTMVTSITQFISGKLGYTVSIFEVQHAVSRFKLSHIHCTSWPDHTAPKDCSCVIAIHKMLLKNRLTRPIVVHCSAGIGRTCTLVGVELLLERILLRRNPSAISIVRLMRRCRMGAVQASVQFIFMQLVVMELFCEDGMMKANDPRMADFRRKYVRFLKRYNENMEAHQKNPAPPKTPLVPNDAKE